MIAEKRKLFCSVRSVPFFASLRFSSLFFSVLPLFLSFFFPCVVPSDVTVPSDAALKLSKIFADCAEDPWQSK